MRLWFFLSLRLCEKRRFTQRRGEKKSRRREDVAYWILSHRTSTAIEIMKAKLNSNDKRVERVLALAKKYDVAPSDVQTNSFSVDQSFRGRSESRVLLGYTVRKDIVIILKDVSSVASLISDVLKAGISEVESVEFRTTQLRKYKDQARSLAMKAAQEKATALASEVGQKIGKAFSMEEESQGSGVFTIEGQDSNSFTNAVGPSTESITTQNTIALGQLRVKARVTVKFELH